MSKLIKNIDWAGKQLDVIARWSLVLAMLIIIVNIVLRGLGIRFLGAYEWVGLILVLVNGFSLAFCTAQDGHVSVDFLTEKLPARVQKTLDIVINLISTTFLFFVFVQLFIYARSLTKTGEVSLTAEIPVYPFVFALSAGLLMFFLSFFARLLKSLEVKETVEINAGNKNQISS